MIYFIYNFIKADIGTVYSILVKVDCCSGCTKQHKVRIRGFAACKHIDSICNTIENGKILWKY